MDINLIKHWNSKFKFKIDGINLIFHWRFIQISRKINLIVINAGPEEQTEWGGDPQIAGQSTAAGVRPPDSGILRGVTASDDRPVGRQSGDVSVRNARHFADQNGVFPHPTGWSTGSQVFTFQIL